MPNMYEVVAHQISASINVRQCRSVLPLKSLYSDSDELFLKNGDQKFVYVFQYGLVSFFNHTIEEIDEILKMLAPSTKGKLEEFFTETIQVNIEKGKQKVSFDKVVLPDYDQEAIRLVMLNTSQSVALDRYAEITQQLLLETNGYTLYLEQHGKLNISGNKLKKFIGKVLNIKNQINENLYIFDSPDSTWENEQLNRLDNDLKRTFDLKDRYRGVHENTEIVKENLELFKDIMEHRESSRLEWIVIILILVEVLDLIFLRILKWGVT
ncbi:MAG: RMD1 family protein [Flavobacteriaceae bacterium]